MDIKELQSFIDNDYHKKHEHLHNEEVKTKALVMALRVHYKAGKFSREVLKSFGYANKKQMEEPLRLDVKLTGLIFEAMCLARCLDIDLESAFQHKMEMVKEKI